MNSEQEPFARLPERIALDLAELAVLLGALDEAAELSDRGTQAHRSIRAATRLLTGKVWPELGELLEGDEG